MSQDIPRNGNGSRVPEWVKFLLAIAVSLAAGAVGYGELKAKVSSLEQRIDRDDARKESRERDDAKALEDMRNTLGDLQLSVARICVRVKC